jgi:hypothetical protein
MSFRRFTGCTNPFSEGGAKLSPGMVMVMKMPVMVFMVPVMLMPGPRSSVRSRRKIKAHQCQEQESQKLFHNSD